MIEALSILSKATFEPRPHMSASPMQSPAAGFGSVMAELANSAVNTIRNGEQAAAAGIVGDMPVRDVVERVLEAERALQTVIAVRDKAVSAYLEISRMQI